MGWVNDGKKSEVFKKKHGETQDWEAASMEESELRSLGGVISYKVCGEWSGLSPMSTRHSHLSQGKASS